MPTATKSPRLTKKSLLQVCQDQFGLEASDAVIQIRSILNLSPGSSIADLSKARLKKLKISKTERMKKPKIAIQYQLPPIDGNDDWRDFGATFTEAPKSSFDSALEELVPFALDVVELDKDYGDTARIIGISFSYADDEESTMGIVITVEKNLQDSTSPFIFNTPHKPVAPYGGGEDASNCLSDKMVKALNLVIQETLGYLQGDREQLSLL